MRLGDRLKTKHPHMFRKGCLNGIVRVLNRAEKRLTPTLIRRAALTIRKKNKHLTTNQIIDIINDLR